MQGGPAEESKIAGDVHPRNYIIDFGRVDSNNSREMVQLTSSTP